VASLGLSRRRLAIFSPAALKGDLDLSQAKANRYVLSICILFRYIHTYLEAPLYYLLTFSVAIAGRSGPCFMSLYSKIAKICIN